MSVRRMDLRPATVRARTRESRERRLVARCAGIAGCVLVVAWTVGALRLGTARRVHADMVERAEYTMAIESELATAVGELDRLGSDLAAWRRVSIPFAAGDLIAAIVADLPESASLERLELDADSLVATPLRTPRRDEARADARRIDGEIEGFATSDESVAAFVDAIRRRPFFEDVRVESTRHREVAGHAARAFRIAFEVDLDQASPAPDDTVEDGEERR